MLAAVCVSSLASAQVVLPFFEDFEQTSGETYLLLTPSLNGAPEWSFNPVTPGARLRLAAGSGFYASGSHAATLDRDTSITAVAVGHLTLTLDMTNYTVPTDSVVLDFKHMHHGDENHANDRVWVRGSSADPYIQIFNLAANQGSAGQYNVVKDLDITAALAAASQQFGTTFQVRFGQEDDFSAISPTGTDGRTFDDVVVRHVLNNDMTIQSINLPADQSCGSLTQDVEVVVFNAGANTQSNIPLTVDITGDFSSTFMVNVPGPVLKNQAATVNVGQLDTYVGGNINISATVNLANDDDTTNDNTSVARVIKPVDVTVTPPASVCPGESAIIAVEPEPFTTFELYDAAMAGNLIDTGDMLTTTPLDQLTTFYVQRVNATVLAGAADNTIGNGAQYGSFDNGLVFNVTTPIRINAVSVYPGIEGQVTVQVLNSDDTVAATSLPYAVQTADVGNKTRIELNATLPVGGSYKMVATGSTTPLYRNSDGAMYPYDIAGWAAITGTNTVLSNAYYFFYDWEVERDIAVCGAGDRTPVDADVDTTLCSADVAVTIAGPSDAAPEDEVSYLVTVSNNGPNMALNTSVDMPTPSGLTFVGNSGDCTNAYPCNLGDVPAGEMRTITSKYTVDATFTGAASFTASGKSDSGEGAPGDESASAQLDVSAPMGSGGGGGLGSGGSGGEGAGGGAGGAGEAGAGGGAGDVNGSGGGCSCRSGGAPAGTTGWWLLLTGVALASVRRRRRRQPSS